jgi:N-acetylneuraminic acid mutarotase
MPIRRRDSLFLITLCSAAAGCSDTPTNPATAPDREGARLDAVALAPNTWETRANMLFARQRSVAGATLNNVIYVVGGTTATGVETRSVQAYTIATNTWSTRAPLPSARTEMNGASVIDGLLYVTGGFNGSGDATRTLYRYNPATNVWTRRADMPDVGACGAQGVIGGLLYVYTGGTACGSSDFEGHGFFRYNPATDSWTTRASPSTVHQWGVGRVIGGRFYLAGGRDDVSDINLSVEQYTPATNSWRNRAPMPNEQLRAASGVLNGRLYVAGGGQVGTPLRTLREYNPATNTWSTRAPMPTPRWSTFGVNAGGKLWVIGGLQNNNSGITKKVEAYTP